MIKLVTFTFLTISTLMLCKADDAAWELAVKDPTAAHLARPTPQQFDYQEQERTLFIHFSLNTWTENEYDLGGISPEVFNPTKLDTDQWCQAAQNMGAKGIVFVAKHVGGFCLWQTETTDYSLKSAPWKDGKGDVLRELSESCRKFGLNLGIYIYPGDMRWGAGIGSAGRTSDPDKQEAYNQVLREQWRQVLTGYGPVNELWFDGSVQVPLDDIIREHAPEAVVFQGPLASIRWPGSESGKVPYPAWNSLKKEDLDRGTATVYHSNPDGDAWAPLECDTPLYDHKWFWSENNEKFRKSLDHLMQIYYQSTGHGAMLLLNASPNTDGLIPVADMQRYKEFGSEINRRFSHPLAETRGAGAVHTLVFPQPTLVNHVVVREDYRHGERIREFVIEGRDPHGVWMKIYAGSAVGYKHIGVFKEHLVTELRLTISEHVGTPLVRAFKAYQVEGIAYDDYLQAITQGKPATASHAHSAGYGANLINDGNMGTRWSSTDDGVPCWIEIDLGTAAYINRARLHELTTRVEEFSIDYRNRDSDPWQIAFAGEGIGQEIDTKFPTVFGRYFRLNISKASSGPTLWNWELFQDPAPAFVLHRLESGEEELNLDITKYFIKPGPYKIAIRPREGAQVEVTHFEPLYNLEEISDEIYRPLEKNQLYLINRTDQIVETSTVQLKLHLSGDLAGTEIVIMPPSY